MKCPKCQKPLKLIHARIGDFYSHTYTLAEMTGDKKICDYSQQIAHKSKGITPNK